MYTELTVERLRSGEPMAVGVVLCPDQVWANRIIPFLWHKGGAWNAHIAGALNGEIRDLETRFYLGLLEDRVICNVMTVEFRGVGILGHVFTVPDQRRKGACNCVMTHQMDDFRQRNGKCLYLGTGYDTPPYHIYRGFGFESVYAESGFMVYTTSPDFHQRHFVEAACAARPVQWRDWPGVNLLTAIEVGPTIRNVAYGAFGITNFEGPFCELMADLAQDDSRRRATVLETQTGALVGFTTLVADHRWGLQTHLLDLFVHPAFAGSAPLLRDSLELPGGKVQAHLDAHDDFRGDLLTQIGFQREATLRAQVGLGRERHDVAVYSHLAA